MEGKKNNKIKKPSGSEVAWLETASDCSHAIVPLAFPATPLSPSFSSLHPHSCFSLFFSLPWSFFAYSCGLVPFPFGFCMILFSFFSYPFLVWCFFYSISLPSGDWIYSGLFDVQFFSSDGHAMTTSSSWVGGQHIRFYGVIWRGIKMCTHHQVKSLHNRDGHAKSDHSRCHWRMVSQKTPNNRSFLTRWFT